MYLFVCLLLEQSNTFPGTWYAVIDVVSFCFSFSPIFKGNQRLFTFICQDQQHTWSYIKLSNLYHILDNRELDYRSAPLVYFTDDIMLI